MKCGIMKKNRLVLVTGASKGIGRVIADKFLENGYDVVYGYNNTIIKDKDIFSLKVDVASRNSVQNAIKQSEKRFGKSIDILINNAGIAQEKDFLTISEDDWATMLNTNLASAYRFTQELLPNMINKKWGRIINITSIGGQWGGFNQVHYAASKAGLISFTMSMAKIYSKHGITSNAISPGLVETDMSKNEMQTEAGKEKIKNIPMNRLGTKEEIANIALFLASDESSYVTGQTINANGGMYFG